MSSNMTTSLNGVYGAMFGRDQTWQDMRASRAVNTAYQNTTTRPIMVAMEGGNSVPSDVEVSNNGSTWFRVAVVNLTSADIRQTTFVVPAGGWYRVPTPGTVVGTWMELR